MVGLILRFIVLALIIVAAGTTLAQAADRIAQITGLGRSFAGFILLAAATSLPELTMDCSAASMGAVDLAVGDLLGSSLFNLLILGSLDFAHRTRGQMLSPLSAAHALSATTSVVLTAILLMGILVPARPHLLGIGIFPLTILGTYLLSVRLIFFDQRAAMRAEPQAEEAIMAPRSLGASATQFLAATLVIFICSPLLVRAADGLAERTGLGGTFVGTTLVALTTSLPEIVTTLSAVRMGAFEMAIGNIFGSNCFNPTIVAAADLFYRPGPILSAVEPLHAVTATSVIIITGLATMGLLYRVEKRFWLVEPDALLVVLLAIGSLTLIFFLS